MFFSRSEQWELCSAAEQTIAMYAVYVLLQCLLQMQLVVVFRLIKDKE